MKKYFKQIKCFDYRWIYLSTLKTQAPTPERIKNNGFDNHDNVIRWKHFPRYWPFMRGIHRSLVNSPHKGQWRGALMFSLICAWINGWVNNRETGDLRRCRAHYGVTVMGFGPHTSSSQVIFCKHAIRELWHILRHSVLQLGRGNCTIVELFSKIPNDRLKIF